MSLLPRDTISIPGVMVTATCVPAREVGGDYYNFIRLGDPPSGCPRGRCVRERDLCGVLYGGAERADPFAYTDLRIAQATFD